MSHAAAPGRWAGGVLSVLGVVLLAGCSSPEPGAGEPNGQSAGSTAAVSEAPAEGSDGEGAEGDGGDPVRPDPRRTRTPTRAPDGSPVPPTDPDGGESRPAPGSDRGPRAAAPWTLPAVMRDRIDSGRLRRLGTVAETDAYTRYQVAYRSGDLDISGVLLVPRGAGPFPGVVLNHGYIEPSIYVSGQGLAREQDYLARSGFVVLHTDYRGHAGSDPATPLSRETRLGYTRDTIAAVEALRREPYVDTERMAMLGRSMGGGITLNALVARPGLVDAAVVYASVSSRYLDNLRRWTLAERPEAAQALFDRFGTPAESPEFYRALSARTYFERVTEPVLLHHGTSDDSCPLAWSLTTQRLLQRAGVDSRLEVYQGEEHAFVPQWERSMRLTVAFLRRRLS